MGITPSRFFQSTDTISQHATEPAAASGSNVPPLSNPAGSSTPDGAQTVPSVAVRNGIRDFLHTLGRFNPPRRNNTSEINRAPFTADANPQQSPAAAIEQGVETVPVQHADAASAAQAEVASQHSSADSSGAERASRSPSLLEAVREFGWVLPLVDNEYQPAAGDAVPAATTASAAQTTDDGLPVFAGYGMPSWLDPAVREALQSINPVVTSGLALNALSRTGTVGPVLDKEMVKCFNLDPQHEHRFIEKETDGRRRTFVFSYFPGKKWIESIHLVEFEGASTSALRAKQTVTINGVKKTLFVEREQESQQLVRVDTPESRVRARVKAFAKGAQMRAALQREFQEITPYRNQFHYALATRAFSRPNGMSSERSAQTAGEWNVYRSSRAVSLLKERSAVLHSFRMKGHLEGALAELEAPPSEGKHAVSTLGHVYGPAITHNMKVNAAWMLGLAHHQIPAVLTTPLTAELLLRRTRKDDDAQSLSALCRELVGLLQNGYFRVETNRFGKKTLVPTSTANAATLDSMRVPPKGDLNEIIAFLEQNKLPVLPQVEELPRTTSRFDVALWWRELLMQDLKGQDESFANLNTLISSGVQVPHEIFNGLLGLLMDFTLDEFRDLVLAYESIDPQDPINGEGKQNIQGLLKAKARMPDFLGRILSGMTDDAEAAKCVVDVANNLFLFKRLDTENASVKKMIDCMHERAIEIKDVPMRTDLLNRLMHNIVALEINGTSDDAEDFPILAHALNAKMLNPRYQMWRPVEITDAMYEKLPLTGALCRTAVANIDTEGHPDTMRAMCLGLKIVDLLKPGEERREGLDGLAYGIRNVTDLHAGEWFAMEVMKRRKVLSNAVHQDLLVQEVGHSLIQKEVGGADADIESIRRLLAKFDIPMCIDIACAVTEGLESKSDAEQRRRVNLARALVAAAPQRNPGEISEHGLQQIIQFIASLEFIRPAQITEPNSPEPHKLIESALEFVDDYLQGADSDAEIRRQIQDALTVSLTGTSALTPEEAIEALRGFDISDLVICNAACERLHGSDQINDEHALNFVLHCANTMNGAAQAKALESLLERFGNFPFYLGANDIVETVARQLNVIQSSDAEDGLSELTRANLTLELASALVGFNVLQHRDGLDMLISYSSVPDGRDMIVQLFAAGDAYLTGVQMIAVEVILEQIDSMRTAEKYYAVEPRVEVLVNLVRALPSFVENSQGTFDELCEFLKIASDAAMDEESRHYLTQELMVALAYIDVENTHAQLTIIELIERNLGKVRDNTLACKLSRKLIDPGESIFSRHDDTFAWRLAVDVVARRFGINIPHSVGMKAADRSAFVLGSLPQEEEDIGQRMQEGTL